MEVFDAILTRRSVRSYVKKDVEDEKITKVLDSARWAPTAGNSQEWRFIVVQDSNKRFQVAEACLGQFWMTEAPVFIVVCAKIDLLESIYGPVGRDLFSLIDCACAMENMLLVARSEGLGSCLVASFDEVALKRILSLPDEIKPVGVLTVGYPLDYPNPPLRKSLDSLVFFEEYNKKWIKGTPEKKRILYI